MSRLVEELRSQNTRATEKAAELRRKIVWRFSTLSMVGDTVAVFGGLILAYWLTYHAGIVPGGMISEPAPALVSAAYVAIIGLALLIGFAHNGIYESSFRP